MMELATSSIQKLIIKTDTNKQRLLYVNPVKMPYQILSSTTNLSR